MVIVNYKPELTLIYYYFTNYGRDRISANGKIDQITG